MISAVEAALGATVPREAGQRLVRYVDLLKGASATQNLVARSSLDAVWHRHIADSAQLVPLGASGSAWVDIGSGAGLPGLVIAIITEDPVTLIEPRKLRAEFLRRAANELELAKVVVVASKAQSASGHYDVITARAVAPAPDLLRMSAHFAHRGSRFLLMKGRGANKELEDVRRTWQGDFRLVASRTDPEAAIIVGERVRARGKR